MREIGQTYAHTSRSSFGCGKPDARNAVGFFVEEDDIGNVADLGAFVTDIFFYIEDGAGVFLSKLLGGLFIF